MGKLRDGILALQKTCINMEPQIADLEKQQDDLSQQVFEAAGRIKEGLNTLVLYLLEKLKKEGKTFESEAAKPLKGELDSNATAFGKGIVQAKADVKAILGRLNAKHKASATALLTSVNTSSETVSKLRAIADKKKAKWLKSDKYKAKIGGYLTALGALDDILGKQTEAIKAIGSLNQGDSWVEKNFKFSQDMTMKQVRDLASVDFNTNLKDFKAGNDALQGPMKRFRNDFKSMGPQLALMKKWTEDADGMEAEAEEK